MKSDFKVAFLTGAGISAESGIATFRGMGGMWENHSIEEVATLNGFKKNPFLVWQFYEARRRQALGCKPNKGHLGLARLQGILGEEKVSITTQNVDGLHQRAGTKNVLELHGSLWKVRCVKCSKEEETFDFFEELPPKCSCGGMLRPAIVWFGEPLPQDTFQEAYNIAGNSNLYIVIGTSGIVEPAASLARIAARHGAAVWEINPEESALTYLCEKSWRSKAGEVIDLVIEEILKLTK